MDDALESILEAMDAATRLIGRLEDEIMAAREANLRLTKELVDQEARAIRLLAQVDQLEARLTRREP